MMDLVRIVLVGTTHPGNIGGAARAMKTMGLSRLHLVQPKDFPSHEASARASGADDVLATAQVHESLDDAVADCRLVIGASARLRSIRWPQFDAREAAERIAADRLETAIVFGREHSGLSNEELDRCNYLLHISSNADYSSLNLAAAVQVVSYELMMAQRLATAGSPPRGADAPADQEAVEGMFRHLEQTLLELEFLDPNNPKHLMRRLRRLFGRVQLDHNEVSILRGICSAAQRFRRLARDE